MQVDAIRRTPAPLIESAIGVRRVGDTSDLLDMAERVDFVISTVTLTNETRNLFDMSLFERMRRSAFVINVSRGPVVNEADLIVALKIN